MMSRNRAARRQEIATRRKIDVVETYDSYAAIRHGLKEVAWADGHWAGIPMPLQGHPLVVEPRYPKAKELSEIGREEPGEDDDITIRNRFRSTRYSSDVVVFEKDGRVRHGIVPGVHSMPYALATLGASDAWGIGQEHNALQLLGTLVSHRQMKQYLLTGMFLESSARSKVTYLFRKLRPTIAISTAREESRILAALCLHPIAHYSGSWAGAMCPTDDVIAHLMLMRGDEPMFWRRANQHPPYRPEAGL
ncbi:hypothetical protein [Nitrobacter sp.]|uniref:hypothetical protein n=1 Tax=Nitrobacter sp. TaxID=29420 RepID=UPI0029CABA3D|nr:hypothetical protein [Nitrobacter sp.]